MRAWSYYALHSLINQIRKFFSQTVVIILVIVAVFAFIGFGVGFVGDLISPSDDTQIEEVEEEDDEDEISADEMSPEDLAELKDVVTVGVFGLILVFQMLGLMEGARNGSDIFTMADVNFLFPAPMKPQSVLLFRMTFAMLGALAGGIYLLFQGPIWLSDLGVSALSEVGAMLSIALFFLQQKVLSVLSYTFFSVKENMKKYVRHVVLIIFAALVCLALIAYISCDKSVIKALHMIAVNPVITAIPVFGWTKGLAYALLNDQTGKIFLFLGMEIAGMAAMVYVTWHIKADFYEDALTGAQVKQAVDSAVSTGKPVSISDEAREKREKNLLKAEKKQKPAIKGVGAQVFFYREICQRFRFAKLGLITVTFDVYFLLSLGLPLILLFLNDYIFPFGGMVICFGLVMTFRNMGNPIEFDMDRPWLVMVPESPYKKLFMVLLGGTVIAGLDFGIPLIIAAFLCEAAVTEVLISFAALLIYDFFLSALSLEFHFLFPDDSTDSMRETLKLFLKIFLCGLILLLYAVFWMAAGLVISQLIMSVVMALLGSVFFILDGACLHEGRK